MTKMAGSETQSAFLPQAQFCRKSLHFNTIRPEVFSRGGKNVLQKKKYDICNLTCWMPSFCLAPTQLSQHFLHRILDSAQCKKKSPDLINPATL
jgi:hypothetical protein